jgi:hypothetical protein
VPRSSVNVKLVLPDKVRGGVVFVQFGKHWRKRLARAQLLRRRRIFAVHIHHEVGVRGEERHLTFRIATIRAVRIGLDELADRETIGGFGGGDGDVLAHGRVSLFDRFGHRIAITRGWPVTRETPRRAGANPPMKRVLATPFTSDAKHCERPAPLWISGPPKSAT